MTYKLLIGVAGVVVAAMAAVWLLRSGEPAIGPAAIELNEQRTTALAEHAGPGDPSSANNSEPGERREAIHPSGSVIASTAEAYDLEIPEETTVLGRVIDTEGRPVSGAPIVIELEGEWERETTSDPFGSFRLVCPSEASRPAVLQVHAHGFLGTDIVQFGHEANCAFPPLDVPTIDVGDLVLQPAGVATGLVVDESGDPVEGARVRANPWWFGTETDAGGAFLLHGLDLGDNYLRVDAPGFVDSGTSVLLKKDVVHDTGPITLEPLQPIHVKGHVVDTEGQPIASAIVYTSDEQVSTAPDGSFEFEFHGEDKVYLRARAEGFRESTAKACFADSTVRLVLHTMGPLCQFLLVDDASGRPISGASIVLLMTADGRDATGSSGDRRHAVVPGTTITRSGDDGRLEARAESAHDELQVTAPGHGKKVVQVSPEAELGAIQEIRLSRSARTTIAGWVPADARPTGAATVEIQWLERLKQTETEDGTITREWTSPPASVQSQAQLRAWLGDAPVLRVKSGHRLHADRRGRFEYTQAATGMARALVQVDETRVAMSEPLRLRADETAEAGELALVLTGSLEGNVAIPHPDLASALVLKLEGAHQQPLQVDEQGHFTASGLAPGWYLLVPTSLPEAAASDLFHQVVAIRAGETTSLVIESGMAPCGEVALTLEVNGQAPSGGFGIEFQRGSDAYSEYFSQADPRPWRMIVPAADGYRVIVEPFDGTSVNTYFELESTVDVRVGSSRFDFKVETCSVTCAVGRKLQHHLPGAWQLLRFKGPDGKERDRIDAANHVVFETWTADSQDYIEVVFPFVPIYARDLRLLVEGRGDHEVLLEVPLDVTLHPGGSARVVIE